MFDLIVVNQSTPIFLDKAPTPKYVGNLSILRLSHLQLLFFYSYSCNKKWLILHCIVHHLTLKLKAECRWVGLLGLVHDYYSANPFRIVHSAAGTLVFLINTRLCLVICLGFIRKTDSSLLNSNFSIAQCAYRRNFNVAMQMKASLAQNQLLFVYLSKVSMLILMVDVAKFFTYVTKTCPKLTTYTRKLGNNNGTIFFENDIMKKSYPVNLKFTSLPLSKPKWHFFSVAVS